MRRARLTARTGTRTRTRTRKRGAGGRRDGACVIGSSGFGAGVGGGCSVGGSFREVGFMRCVYVFSAVGVCFCGFWFLAFPFF